jgi:hypothetical protein
MSQEDTMNPSKLTYADHACVQYELSIPAFIDSTVSSTKKPGLAVPAQRKHASGLSPPYGSQAAARACSEASASVKEYE